MTVLISTIPGDFHAKAVMWGLNKLGADYFAWVPNNIPDFAKGTIGISRSPDVHNDTIDLHCLDRTFSSSDISVFWNRRKAQPKAPKEANIADIPAIEVQSAEFAANIEVFLSQFCPSINPPDSKTLSNNKSIQLKFAREVGFSIPETIISNNPKDVRNFLKNQGEVIAKPFMPSAWECDGTVLSSYAAIIRNLDEISDISMEWCPYIYQSLIPATYEVRVICFDNKFFAMKQELSADVGPDARRNLRYGRTKVQSIEVPNRVKEMIVEYLHGMRLRYGAFDFGVDDNDNWFFYECNEAGQFLYLEAYAPEIRILDSFCRWLASFEDPAISKRTAEIDLDCFDVQSRYMVDVLSLDINKGFTSRLAAIIE